MRCEEVELELVAYHFGLLSEEGRREVEGHLCDCSACVRSFVDLKRAIELDEEGPGPSVGARARLRRAVAKELQIGEAGRGWSWWERPMAFAVAGSAMVLAMLATHVVVSGPGAPPHGLAVGAAGR